MDITSKDALIVVDVQNDFCPGGALAVSDGDCVVHPLNKLMEKFSVVVATQDWHREDHISFKEQGGIWPPHCVAGTEGAAFHPKLNTVGVTHIVRKATKKDKEAYSGFDKTGLEGLLKSLRVERIFIGGLATDYCVLQTALDSAKAGFKTYVIKDACRAVNVERNDEEKAYQKMETKGIQLIRSSDIL